MRKTFFITVLSGCLAVAVSAQRNGNAPKPTPTPPDDGILRIPLTLVQVDAVVKDKNGRSVTNLVAEDFEILEDGRPQSITNFSYITVAPETPRPKSAPIQKFDKNAPLEPVIPIKPRPGEVKRTIVFVLDNMAFDSLSQTRKALTKFVDKQMQPGDLVAILRMGEGMSVSQQFTTDKRLLYMSIYGLRWIPSELYGVNAIPDEVGQTAAATTANETKAEDPSTEATTHAEEERYLEQNRLHGKLASVSMIVRGLEGLPGRKTVFIFSDNFRLFGDQWSGYDNNRTREELRMVSGQANRVLVTLNTIDARGLQTLNITAADDLDRPSTTGTGSLKSSTAHPNPTIYAAVTARRRAEFLLGQEGMHELAERTGGRFSQSNDPAADINDVLKDSGGYYLIAYTLDEQDKSIEARRSFHKIEVRLKLPGLTIRSRKEYYGIPPVDVALRNNQPAQKMLAAITSPYVHQDVGVKLTSLFGHDLKDGSFIRSLIHVAASDLTFNTDATGKQKAVIKVIVLALDESGIVGDPVAQTYTISGSVDAIDRIKRDGVIYEMMVPVSRAGMYQIRTAVQDAATEQIGTADQLVDVPNVSSEQLGISGILVSGKIKRVGQQSVQANPAMRIMQRGMELNYAFIIYNSAAPADAPDVRRDARIVVYHDGKPVYAKPLELTSSNQSTDLKQIVMKGSFPLGEQFAPGEYVLQVVVSIRHGNDKPRAATRWIDFEVVN